MILLKKPIYTNVFCNQLHNQFYAIIIMMSLYETHRYQKWLEDRSFSLTNNS